MNIKRTRAEIDLDALEYNFNAVKSVANGHIAAVVKADAYGHGASVVAPYLEKLGVDLFAVSNIDEAIELRNSGVKVPILILGFTDTEYAKVLADNSIEQTVYSSEYAKLLSESAQKFGVTVNCHIKLDTGMGRIGFNCRKESLDGIGEAVDVLSYKNLNAVGVFTHFAAADLDGDKDGKYTKEQYERFLNAVSVLENAGAKFKYRHCKNSAATVHNGDFVSDISRAGIILYGLSPSDALRRELNLKPVMELKSTVSFVKVLSKGETVSYGRTFTAEKVMTVATVPIGYADGYSRHNSNKGYVLINGKRAKIIGKVCMDQMMVDVTDIPDVKMGDDVTLFGKDLPVDEVAKVCGTINYELICAVSRRVERIYIKGGKNIKQVSYI